MMMATFVSGMVPRPISGPVFGFSFTTGELRRLIVIGRRSRLGLEAGEARDGLFLLQEVQ
jgi:hypothetical protein